VAHRTIRNSCQVDRWYALRSLLAVVFLASAHASIYGVFIQAEILPFRTLFVPGLELLCAISIFVYDGASFWRAKHPSRLTFHVLLVILCVAVLTLVDKVYVRRHADIISMLPRAIAGSAEGASQIRKLEFKPTSLEEEISGQTCRDPQVAFKSIGVEGFHIDCGRTNVLVEVVLLWSQVDVLARHDGR
jgi:hypothetical protein